MEAIAKHDFTATAEDELSFRKNQILKVRMFAESVFLALFVGFFFVAVLRYVNTIRLRFKIDAYTMKVE